VLADLRHPNIVGVFGVVSKPPMLIMQLCHNGSLRELLRSRDLASLPWPQRADILTGVASGVEFLHLQTPQIIHLDLKVLRLRHSLFFTPL
jgi:serine/threonine protein kinase